MLKFKIDSRIYKNNLILKIILVFLCLFILLILSLYLFLYYLKSIWPFPNVKDYKAIPMPESSIIYDRDWNELYKIYSEKRTYVPYNKINKNMINAIIAWEDKRFWTNPWYDIIWILRSIYVWILNQKEISWTSWITQQLARVTYLTTERTIERKIKELYLSIELNSIFEKKDILELYLNKIFFWWNSYWIEQASQTYFWNHAFELSVLQSSILASLPKAPTLLSPYNNKDLLVWYPLIKSKNDKDIKILSKNDLETYENEIKLLEKFINNLNLNYFWNDLQICWIDSNNFKQIKFSIDSNWCSFLEYNDFLDLLNSISIKTDEFDIEYKTWRKDYVLWRMLEDSYINFSQYKKSIIEWFWIEFKEYSDDIKYPHFVMYIRDLLVKKYSQEKIYNSWYRIYTTIDPKLQDKAEELIKKQTIINKEKFNVKNGALISLDNTNWEILSMVWWVDYFDEDNLGYNNMVFARLQPWSTFKPFIYTLSMIKNWYTKDTIFTDAKFTFPWDYTPENSDWKFMWKLTLSKALNYSRNIPAVKNYYAAWEENEIIKFLTPFWIKSLLEVKKEFKQKNWYDYVYLAPMALWTVQITPFELAEAYSIFANSWVKNETKSILKILDSSWNIIENNENQNNKIKVLDSKYALEINSILSNSKDRPNTWNYFLTIPSRQMAAKTWTSSNQYKKDPKDEKEIILPKDLWTVWYTPQITTVVWVWNTTWEELKQKAYWLTCAWPILRDFMEFAHKDLEIKTWNNSDKLKADLVKIK